MAVAIFRRSCCTLARHAALAVGLLLPVCALAQNSPSAEAMRVPVLSGELTAARAALDKYQDPVVAVHDGYFSTLGCVAYASGGMGVHFLNPGAIGPTVEVSKPQILIYEPVGEALRLVAAEWFVPLATGVKERPQIFGQPFDGPMEGHPPLMAREFHHYDLHVWLWKENPNGIFAQTNPDVKCPPGAYSFMEEPPPLVSHQ